MRDVNSETIDIATEFPNKFSLWVPHVGQETLKLLSRLDVPDAGKTSIQSEALSVLSRCVPPQTADKDVTGLVIGYVQSGKTISFTTVSALACDNSYPIIIVITGTSEPLFKQSTQRLRDDLGLNGNSSERKWHHFPNPSRKDNIHHTLENILEDWNDPKVKQADRQVILITVMKNHRHLKNLIEVLSDLELRRVPTIVIDDEADQAGLNTLARSGDESTTYHYLLELRRALPHHSYLQYTATPQAPLLINLIDALSPDFAEVLTPGKGYVGGKEFFNDENRFVKVIPIDEIDTKQNDLTEPPDSLLYAMKIFYLGVAANLVTHKWKKGNRSMLVHPSQKTMGHKQYYSWVKQVAETWKKTLELDENDPDYQFLVESFRDTYDDLGTTVQDLPSFEELTSCLARSIRRTEIKEVNATRGKTPEIDWKANYSYILVGGQAMDRGFTVEGLTVTYMSRGVGVGNADTVQQRARFFGYKKHYLGFCRVFLENIANITYKQYVYHEEDIRKQLISHREKGLPLSEWKRAFFLNEKLKPTRNNVLTLDYMRGNLKDTWYSPKAPHDSPVAVADNREVVKAFLSSIGLVPSNQGIDHDQSESAREQRYKSALNIPLKMAFADLLTLLRVTRPSDSQKFTGALLQIQKHLENNPNAICSVYLLSNGEERTRSLNDNDEIGRLSQGAAPDHDTALHKRGELYPGDDNLHGERGVTIQIQFLKLVRKESREVVANDVPVIRVWIPEEMSASWYVQEEQNKSI